MSQPSRRAHAKALASEAQARHALMDEILSKQLRQTQALLKQQNSLWSQALPLLTAMAFGAILATAFLR